MTKLRYGKLITVLIHIAIIFFAFFIQTSIFPLLPFFSTSPNLLLIITFSYGLIYGETIGLLTGIFCGLVCDMYYNGVFGSFLLIYSLIGFGNGMLNTSFTEDSITLPMILSFGNGIIYNVYIYLTHFFMRGKYDILYYFVQIMIPNILFTLIVTVILYKVLHRLHFVWKK